MVMLSVLNNATLTGNLGEIAGVNGQNSEGMCQGGKPGTGKLNTDVAPPTPVGAWSMALGLRQRFEYYYYFCTSSFLHAKETDTHMHSESNSW